MHANNTKEAILKYTVESRLMSLPTARETISDSEAKVPAILIPTTAPWMYLPPAAPAIPKMVPCKIKDVRNDEL